MGADPLGLKVNDGKTKYMVVPQKENFPNEVTIENERFEVVDSFKYLGSELNPENDIGREVRSRISAGNRCFYGLQKLFRSRII